MKPMFFKSKLLFTSKLIITLIAVTCTTLTLISVPAEAKRLGGGSGSKIGRPVNNSVFQRNNSPMAARPAAPMSMPMTAPVAAKPANKWLGPLAGLAAGAGLMALMSNMGIGAGVGDMLSNLLMYGALAMLALFVYRRFFAKKPSELNANNTPYSNQAASNQAASNNAYTAPNNTAYASNTAAVDSGYASNNHPAVPDITAFVNNAKSQYLALQVAWDAGDLSKLRTMTTDNLFMELAQQVANRKGAPNHTEIMNLHCELLDVRDEQNDTVATLRFTGTAREDNQPTSSLEDIWMLTKPASSSHGWLLAGVENK